MQAQDHHWTIIGPRWREEDTTRLGIREDTASQAELGESGREEAFSKLCRRE